MFAPCAGGLTGTLNSIMPTLLTEALPHAPRASRSRCLMTKAGEYTLHFLAAVVVAWLAVQLGVVLYVTCKRRGRDKQE